MQRFRSWLVSIVPCVAFAWSACAGAQSVVLDTAASRLAIAPGGTGRLVFDVFVTPPGPVRANGYLGADPAWFAEYTFVPEAPSCAAPTIAAGTIAFDAGSVTGPASIRCAYQVARAAGSVHDIAFGLCPFSAIPHCAQQVRIGTLPDLALRAIPLAATTFVQLTVTNASTRDVADATVATDCRPFDGGPAGFAPFDVVADMPGGCRAAANAPVVCVEFTGESPVSRAFGVGPVPAGGSASCLVRLVRTNGETPDLSATIPIRVYGSGSNVSGAHPVELADSGTGFDVNGTNDAAVLGGFGVVAAVPLGGAASVLLGLGVLCGAARRSRRRDIAAR